MLGVCMVANIKVLQQLDMLDKKSSKMRLAAEEWDLEWKSLIAIMMSAQSRDEMTIKIANGLFEKYPTLASLAGAKYDDVLTCLKSLNYNRTKSKHIIECAKLLVSQYSGVVPHVLGELIKLPGVGQKTANVFLSELGHDAIGVDTHTAYISQKLGWTKNKVPEKIENDLKLLFPKQSWKRINPILVRFGKTYTSKKQKDELLIKIKGV